MGFTVTISKKLRGSFTALVCFLVLVTILGFSGITAVKKRLDHIVQDRVEKIILSARMSDSILTAARMSRMILIIESHAKRTELSEKIRAENRKFGEALSQFEKMKFTETGQKLLAELKSAYAQAVPIDERLIDLALKYENEEARALLLAEAAPAMQRVEDTLEAIISRQVANSKTEKEQAEQAIARVRIIVLAVGLSAVLLVIVMGYLIPKGIITPLNQARAVMQEMAAGDLTAAVENGKADETGQLLRTMSSMSASLKTVIAEVKQTADSVAAASHQLAAGADRMSQGIGNQSTRSVQIATASEEMSQTVVDMARNAASIAESATRTLEVARDGRAIVGKSIEEVNRIAETTEQTARNISSLSERSRQIGEIVTVIKDIADQTNLLALNAAIEAARAGEQGRGFAVVADEVRKLAERTSRSTAEISEMIAAMQGDVEAAIHAIGSGKSNVESGVSHAREAGDALNSIVASVNELQGMVQQIASATEEMSSAAEQINIDIKSIADVASENSGTSGQVSDAAQNLERTSTALQEIVGRFKV
ncbi:MAG: methyl-accepting chemotaxis protein [Nitrospirota bacterium]